MPHLTDCRDGSLVSDFMPDSLQDELLGGSSYLAG